MISTPYSRSYTWCSIVGVDRKSRATVKAILSVLDKKLDWFLVPNKGESLKRLYQASSINLEDEFWRIYNEGSVRAGVERLKRSGKVEFREAESGQEVRISGRGKDDMVRYKLSGLKVIKPSEWDKKWRVILFDIGEMERRKRDILRRWLSRLGMVMIQKSVYIYPYPCENEVEILRQVLFVPGGVRLITAESIGDDVEMREKFGL
ncbi:MAG: Repressor in ring oxydation complex/ phenylacetic acid degradation pathway related protein (PaaX) [Candidatus Amesbacteria bacterium GW2011_GWB1_47_19]|nr:MAG: Repressor in ring oxydation complex/ phenylacetic acid degradation pathway related protein (PaaX) [Candidatus Amesbacteria bacterium GW2011_GWA1_44_24]KKU31436.1 MAG: Repressor in ring oxydation complex/ phenylacetic acid degradation pathway related protein (PaaX) [Candidatus Amesbacteria bacterium GW2011_GWC1_46_24]KKU67444.1 MAG: Repressor in ring oxydation complex/ phenylacetic acid degradation pathway related protein (PaaX) [Candidatus Amesbacteria bacterium GW2011_GWB1_47_19]